MKILPLKIINQPDFVTSKIKPILLYGNEDGLISKIIKTIHADLKKKFGEVEIKYIDHKYDDELIINALNDISLFSKKLLIIVTNPQNYLLNELENLNNYNNYLIIRGEKINSKSKIKSLFDNSNSFIGVPCYALDKASIKQIIDNFLLKYKISLQKDAYWFLLDNVDQEYLILDMELQKLSNFKNESLDLENLRKLIVSKTSANLDNYFFNCATGNTDLILKEINKTNRTINESYEIFLSIKRFIKILSGAVLNDNNLGVDELVSRYLPKYLFLKKNIFKELIKRVGNIQLIKINNILQKTENLLRKNSNQHKEIIERFLLNLSKIMK